MNQNQLAELFDTSKQGVGQHIANILNDRELDANSVVKKFFTTAADGKKYEVTFYSLEMWNWQRWRRPWTRERKSRFIRNIESKIIFMKDFLAYACICEIFFVLLHAECVQKYKHKYEDNIDCRCEAEFYEGGTDY